MLSLFVLLFPLFVSGNEPAPPKTITLTLSKYNQVFMGRDTLSVSDVPKELKNRFWKSYLGTGKMYDYIIVELEEGVTADMKTALLDAIKQGQQMSLKDISLEKHKQYYEDLSEKHKEKLQKQFPVLFQTEFNSDARRSKEEKELKE